MENIMREFENQEFGKIRTVEIDSIVWFVGKDVCKAFGDKNHNRTLGRVDEIDKMAVPIKDSMGRTQNITIVNESGLYAVLFAMQPQKAHHDGMSYEYPIEVQERIEKIRKFKRWVTSEVLPSIRKHGAYMAPETIEQMLLTPDMVIGLATRLKEEQQKLKEEQEKNRKQQTTIVALTEEAQKWDAKSVINALVRKYASVCCGCNFQWAWNRFYKDLEYKEHISLKKRCSKGKKNTPMIDFLVESEYPAAIKIAVALCESVDIDTGKIINEVNLANACAAPA